MWNTSAWKIFLSSSFIYLPNHLFTSVQTHEYLFIFGVTMFIYIWKYNPVVIYFLFLKLLWPTKALSFDIYAPLTYHHHCAHTCICVYEYVYRVLYYPLVLQDVPGSSCIVPFIVLESGAFFFLLDNGIRNHDLGAKCNSHFWVLLLVGPFGL